MLASELSVHPTVEEVAAITNFPVAEVKEFEQRANDCLQDLLESPPSGMHPLLAHLWVASTEHSNGRAKEDSASYLSFVRNRAKMLASQGNVWGLQTFRICVRLDERELISAKKPLLQESTDSLPVITKAIATV